MKLLADLYPESIKPTQDENIYWLLPDYDPIKLKLVSDNLQGGHGSEISDTTLIFRIYN